MDKIQSFRFDTKTMKKLDAIRDFHQKNIEKTSTLIQADSVLLSRRAIMKGLIEQEYFRMVRDGLIEQKEEI